MWNETVESKSSPKANVSIHSFSEGGWGAVEELGVPWRGTHHEQALGRARSWGVGLLQEPGVVRLCTVDLMWGVETANFYLSTSLLMNVFCFHLGMRTRTVKYVGPPSRNNSGSRISLARSPITSTYTVLGTSAPTEISRRDMSTSPPRRTPGFSPNSSFRSAAELKLQRELDDFEQELAEINNVDYSISLLTLDDAHMVDDGHKPGDLKFIKASRFQSPKHSRFEAEPPKGAAKPVGVPMDSATLVKVAPLTGFQVTRQQRSAFFPMSTH